MDGEQSEVVHRAPWANATPEEDVAYDQQVRFGNNEFEADVRNAIGPAYEDYVDADRATFLGNLPEYNYKGFYLNNSYGQEGKEGYTQEADELFGPLVDRANAFLEKDTVYAISAENANPLTWAHEFRHRAFKDMGASLWMPEERYNRLYDAFYASTPEDWYKAVYMWKDQLRRRGEKVTTEQAESHLKKALETWEPQFTDYEANVRKQKGDKPKERKLGPFDFGTLRSDAKEARERRTKIRDISQSVAYNRDRMIEVAREGERRAKIEEIRKAQEELKRALEEAEKKAGVRGE